MNTKYKAVKITKDNKKSLEAQYSMADDFLEYSSGLYVISEFGDRQYQSILTKKALEANFIVGKELRNGFFEIEKKAVESV